MENSTPHRKIVTTKNFNLKLCTRDYVGDNAHHANFGFNRYSGGLSPNRRNITTLWLFLTVLSCPYLFFSILRPGRPLDRFSRVMAQTTCFRARMVLLGVRNDGWPYLGEICPRNSPKVGANMQFPARTAKYKNRNISKTINRIKTKIEDQAEIGNCTSWVV